MEDREMPWTHKYGESTNDSNYVGICASRGVQGGMFEISGHLIFVGRIVHLSTAVSSWK